MYRFALRPAWILSHVFAVASIAAFIALGFWQLDRHDQRAARSATVEARVDLPVVPVTEALAEVDDPDELRFRTVRASGTFGDDDLLVDNRSLEGRPGAWVLTPLRLDDGSVLVVNRGFQFRTGAELRPPAPPEQIVLEGTVATWDDSGCGVRRDDAGDPVGTACLNRDAAEEAFGADVLPVVVQRQVSEPPAPDVLAPVPQPELDSGPHRSYAFQWFTFATLAAIVYLLILRRVARTEAAPADDAR